MSDSELITDIEDRNNSNWIVQSIKDAVDTAIYKKPKEVDFTDFVKSWVVFYTIPFLISVPSFYRMATGEIDSSSMTNPEVLVPTLFVYFITLFLHLIIISTYKFARGNT